MALAPLLDLRPGYPANDVDHSANIEAEQALLGIALYNNAAIDQVEVDGADFSEPTHGRLWDAIIALLRAGRLADAITVHMDMGADPGVISLGGLRYFADLVDRAPPAPNAPDYARVIVEAARRRRVTAIAERAIADLKAGEKTSAAIEAIESDLLALQRGHGRAAMVSAESAVRAMLDDMDAPESEAGGVLTGLGPLDDHLGAMQPDELILIAGRPGMGKSALGACIARNVCALDPERRTGFIEINAEMSVAQMARRHVSDCAHEMFGSGAPTYRDIKRRLITPGQRGMIERAAGEVSRLPLAMVKKTGLTISALRSLVRRQASIWANQGIALGAITVDHVGLLTADGGGRDRYNDQTAIAIGMKALADELHVPVIALVQLSRKVEDRESKRPMLSDLRDSGAWEENADVAIGCFREAYYAQKELEPPDDGRAGAMLKWADWDRRRKSPTIEAILMKVREGVEATIPLWASIGHNAIRAADPDGRLFQ